MLYTLEILNLKCGGCANSVKKGLNSIEGVETVEVDVENGKVSFDATSDETVNIVKEKLANMGYPEVGDANTLIHKAKSFVSCATGRMGSKE
ncbi:MAG: heavy-metal-associated domain-containing protein [Bacteroidetes bacterium]|jgi:copper chaperone CopZ|nr:heavy-metal-associated domain-containing protein [Bacteroidota bacterium]